MVTWDNPPFLLSLPFYIEVVYRSRRANLSGNLLLLLLLLFALLLLFTIKCAIDAPPLIKPVYGPIKNVSNTPRSLLIGHFCVMCHFVGHLTSKLYANEINGTECVVGLKRVFVCFSSSPQSILTNLDELTSGFGLFSFIIFFFCLPLTFS